MQIVLNNALIPDISSTDFRNSKKASLLPKKVYDYIKEKAIYGVR